MVWDKLRIADNTLGFDKLWTCKDGPLYISLFAFIDLEVCLFRSSMNNDTLRKRIKMKSIRYQKMELGSVPVRE